MKKRYFRLLLLLCVCFSAFANTTASFSSVVTVESNVIQVRAWDSVPVTTLTIDGNKTPSEKIVNGDFSQGLTGWSAVGDVALINETEHNVTPLHQNMIRIGRDTEDDSKFVSDNVLSQEIENRSNNVAAVGFWYNFETFETAPGFDEPGFMVYINDQMVHQVLAKDITSPSLDGLRGSEWRFLSVNVSGFSNPTLTLKFHAGNTGDTLRQSFVYIGQVTTNAAIAHASTVFHLHALSQLSIKKISARYRLNGQVIEKNDIDSLSFSFPSRIDDNVLEYWAEDTSGTAEQHHFVQVLFDNTPPLAITDLKATDDGNGNFTLNWTAPSDQNFSQIDQAAGYDIRYSTMLPLPSISDQDWETLPKPSIRTTDGLPGSGLRPPLLAGQQEIYDVHVDGNASAYYFVVRSHDQALNNSPISNVAQGKTLSQAAPELHSQLSDVAHLRFSLQNVQNFTDLEYLVEYDHDVDQQTIHEGLKGQVLLPGNTDSFDSQDIFFGTCSTNTLCVEHEHIQNIQVTVTLRNKNDAVLDTILKSP